MMGQLHLIAAIRINLLHHWGPAPQPVRLLRKAAYVFELEVTGWQH